MRLTPASSAQVRVGSFELDLQAGELHTKGFKVRLQDQPLEVLAMLVDHAGEVVTREELRLKLWPADTFVDFEHGLNRAINKLREALGDDAAKPRYIETLPRRGYRLIAQVESGAGLVPPQPRPQGVPVRSWWVAALCAGVVVSLLAILFALDVGGFRVRLLRRVKPVRIESLAVLPLANLSGDPGQDYLADGMTEELITALAKIGAVRVISHTSVIWFKGARPRGGLVEIARQLKVDAVVEGSVQRYGDRVRVTAQLIEVKTDRHLWAESYERDFRDILALQAAIARAIADEVRAKVTPQQRLQLASAHPINPEAHEAYLKGRYCWEMRTREGLRRSIKYFQQALEKEPGYAMAHAGLADSFIVLGDNGFLPASEAFPRAREAALKALELDDTLAEAHAALASSLYSYKWDYAGAEREFQRALELSPQCAQAYHKRAINLLAMGRPNEAVSSIKRARELDPLSPRINANVGLILYLTRQYDQAIAELNKSLELDPGNTASFSYLSMAYEQKGMDKEAVQACQKRAALLGETPEWVTQFGRAYATGGIQATKRFLLETWKAGTAHEFVTAYDIARLYAFLGEKDQALDRLKEDSDQYEVDPCMLRHTPQYDSLRSDPRFQDLLRHMNLRP